MIEIDLMAPVFSGPKKEIRPLQTRAQLKTYLPIVHEDDRQIVYDIECEMTTGPWIGGGAVLNWHLGNRVETDIDIWFKNEKQYDKCLTRLKKLNYAVHFETENAVTLKLPSSRIINDEDPHYERKTKVQLIKKRFVSSAEEVIDDFDFSICQLVTDGMSIIAGEYTYRDIHSKTIRLVNKVVKDNFLYRWIKYTLYGYTLKPGTVDRVITNAGKDELKYDFSNEESPDY